MNDVATNFAKLIANAGNMKALQDRQRRLHDLFGHHTRADVRRFWDEVSDDSFYHGPEGDFDCDDIHGYLNLIGEGLYCAV